MPALENSHHEIFAQAVFKGHSAIDAYEMAGLKPHTSSASRLLANASIQARIAELKATVAKRVIDTSIFEPKAMFAKLADLIEQAAAAGETKTAIEGQKFMLKCFGYEDGPTLTHEHVRGKELKRPEPATEQEVAKQEAKEVSKVAQALGEMMSKGLRLQ